MFLKRLESSVSAFQTSLDTYKRKLAVFKRGLEIGKIISLEDLSNIEAQLMMGDDDFDPEDIILEEDHDLDSVDDKKYALDELKKDIAKEEVLIGLLEKQLAILEQDNSKIKAFAELIDTLHSKKLAGSKVLVFSFYADTIDYLQKSLPSYSKSISKDNAAFISSKQKADADSIAGRFAPKAKKYELKSGETELSFLFSTDILSEGQNLQDCGMLVNYDLHWNPVRMIQRNGRINRIGTEFPEVYIYNISPEDQLEEYLRLVERLEGKINLIRNTIGTDTPVLDEEENPIEFTDSWENIYSEDLQKRIEAMQQAEKKADLLLSEDDYVSDLKIFNNDASLSKEYKDNIFNIPMGKWSLMPTSPHGGGLRPSVLVFNGMHEADGTTVGHAFISMNRRGSELQAITQLQALEWLKTQKEDNRRNSDKISLDKIQLSEKADTAIEAFVEEEEVGSPIGQQTDVLRIMFENHFDEEKIELVRVAFQTKNVLDRQLMTRIIRKIMRTKRENKPCLDSLRELIDVASQTFEIKDEAPSFDHIKKVLYYVRENN